MKYFKTLQDLIDYVPNCLICGKHLALLIEGRWGNKFSKTDFRSIKTSLIEDRLYSKHKVYNFCIEPKTNEIISGKEYFKVMSDGHVTIYKKCDTCYCVLRFSLADKKNRNWSIFPDLLLDSEEVKYTMRGEKDISIFKNHDSIYWKPLNPLIIEKRMSISINRKKEYYPNDYIDLSKIKDLSSLNKKISTIIVFQ